MRKELIWNYRLEPCPTVHDAGERIVFVVVYPILDLHLISFTLNFLENLSWYLCYGCAEQLRLDQILSRILYDMSTSCQPLTTSKQVASPINTGFWQPVNLFTKKITVEYKIVGFNPPFLAMAELKSLIPERVNGSQLPFIEKTVGCSCTIFGIYSLWRSVNRNLSRNSYPSWKWI